MKQIYDKECYDRLTVTFRKGYRPFLKRMALELNSDVSKVVREATDDLIRARLHRLSEDLRKQYDQISKFPQWK